MVSIGNYNNFTYARNIPDLLLTLQHLEATDLAEGAAPSPTENGHEAEDEPEAEERPEDEAPDEAAFGTLTRRMRTAIDRLRSLRATGHETYAKVFPTKAAEQEYYEGRYQQDCDQVMQTLDDLEDTARQMAAYSDGKRVYAAREYLLHEVKHQLFEFNSYYNRVFQDTLNTATADSALWQQPEDAGRPESAPILLGRTTEDVYNLFGEMVPFERKTFLHLFDHSHLLVRYTDATRRQVLAIANTVIARSLAAFQPGMLRVTMIDAEDMSGTSDALKALDREVFTICARPDSIRQSLTEAERSMESTIQNLLQSPITNIRDYNAVKSSKEPYHLIIIKDFPAGFHDETVGSLRRLMKNGIRAGINIMLLQNDDLTAHNEDGLRAERLLAAGQQDGRQLTVLRLDHEPEDIETLRTMVYDTIGDRQLQRIVTMVNADFDVKTETAVNLTDHLPAERQWWQRHSDRQVEIAFGIGDDKQPVRLKITQESGQNSAVVIGIPGSGKSIFLHTVILSAATTYSPDELQLYLIDFSGVEFNAYALHRLPHARVIAPEAEREFGLSILRELAEEGRRRMELCRDHDVSNIIDLKAARPDLQVPRLLVVIDEFQKFFEIENDAISREANMLLHTIIQEFRKFGINLLLATQRLPQASVLPRDLIANRILFRSSPADFTALITLNSGERMPMLATGECIYNSESGSPYDNRKVKTFFVSKKAIDSLLDRLTAFTGQRGTADAGLRVFRSGEQPDFLDRRMAGGHQMPADCPDEVGIYLGESIAIAETDVYAPLHKESNNNLLVIGGDPDVAQRIAVYASLSATLAHTKRSAHFYFFNFMRQSDPLAELPRRYFEQMPFDSVWASRQDEVLAALQEVKAELDARRQDETRPLRHVYLSLYAFQLGRMFDKGGRRGDDPSEQGALLAYIIKNGPQVGIFTLLQVDNLQNLSRIETPLTLFTHKVALQMDETESNKVVGSAAASKLFVMNSPASRHRAYYCERSLNINIKFKPYK